MWIFFFFSKRFFKASVGSCSGSDVIWSGLYTVVVCVRRRMCVCVVCLFFLKIF
jgi:hypothetical protein